MRRLLSIAALLLPAVAYSQQADGSDPAQWKLLPIGSRVRARAEGILAGRQTAVLLRRSGDTLTLGVKGDDPVAVPISRISSLETSIGASRSLGAVRGAIVLGTIGATLYQLGAHFGGDACLKGAKNECAGGPKVQFTASGFATNTVVGAAFGSILGTFWPIEAWRSIRLSPTYSVGAVHPIGASAGFSFAI